MTEFFDIVGSLVEFVLNQLANIGRYFQIATSAFGYMIEVVYSLPLYMKAFVLALLGISVALMILNRGT